jgi:ketosteroid isomerase-like protein
MKTLVSCVVLFLMMMASTVAAQTATTQPAPDAAELTKLLNDFLAGASRNDPAVHERFWADDLIYTRSAGRRVSKADILRDLKSAPAPKPDDPKTVYTAEDIRIQQYGNTAIVAFRLVATTEVDGGTQVQNLLNSGTFLKRNGKWQVVNWQSTRMPRTEEENKADVAAVTSAFYEAFQGRDAKKLRALTDTTLVFTENGKQVPWQFMLDNLRYAVPDGTKLDVPKRTISVYGDTAVVRGESTRKTDTGTVTVLSTMILVNQAGAWKIVALHTSD